MGDFRLAISPAGNMNRFRILTYNVRRCLGLDGNLSPERIAEVIHGCGADIVALQELDVGRARTSHIDQAQEISALLQMHLHFHPALRVLDELYGDAILTAKPAELRHAAELPGVPGREPRGALHVCVELGGRPIQVINTHLGLTPRERRLQVDCLLGSDWIGHVSTHPYLLVVGDFNALPHSRTYRRLSAILKDAKLPNQSKRCGTFPSGLPLFRLDYVFVGPAINVLDWKVIRSPLTRVASDHLPLVVDFSLSETHTLKQH